MDFVHCKIALGGDAGSIMCRGMDNPVSWPEIRVLQYLHGEDNVFDCEFSHSEDQAALAEKMRLQGIYGAEPVNLCYPGARPVMEMEFPGDRVEPITTKRPERKLISDIIPRTELAPAQDEV